MTHSVTPVAEWHAHHVNHGGFTECPVPHPSGRNVLIVSCACGGRYGTWADTWHDHLMQRSVSRPASPSTPHAHSD